MGIFQKQLQKIIFSKSNTARLEGRQGGDIPTSKELRYKALQRIFSILASTTDFDQMTQKAVDVMAEEMDYLGGNLWLYNEEKKGLVPWTLTDNSMLNVVTKWLNKSLRDYTFTLDMEESLIVRTYKFNEVNESKSAKDFFYPVVDLKSIDKITSFLGLNSIISLPVKQQERIIGVVSLASPREKASAEELEMLETFASQVAIAIQNARLFQQTNDQLEQIKQNYLDLQTIQKITSYTISTLDLRLLTQQIVDIVPDQLGNEYIGTTFLRRMDEQNKEFEIFAMTDSATVKKIRSFVEQKIDGASLDLGDTRFTESIRTRLLVDQQPLVDKGLGELIRPLLPAPVLKTIEKAANIQCTVVYPAVFQNRVVGLLVFGLTIAPDLVDDRHLSMMRAVADQVAIGINNAANFERLRMANEDLQTAYADLKSLDKAKSEFLSIASHQLRTPLSAIRGYLSLVQDGDFGVVPPAQLTVLDKTQDNVKRLVTLVNDLLSLARIEAGTTRNSLRVLKQDFREMIDETIEELKLKALNKDLQLVWEKPENPVWVEFDRDRLEQVVTNLVDNAIYYTESGSITITLKESAETVELTVKDTGIGINPESLSNMFTKFYRAPEAVIIRPDGTGIGLYVAKMMMDIHKGEIWVESEMGKGSEFHIRLPKTQPKAAFAETEPLTQPIGMLDAEPHNEGITLADIFHRGA